MGLIPPWLGGDFDLIERWGRMYREKHLAHSANNAHQPDSALLRSIEQATAPLLRAGAMLRAPVKASLQVAAAEQGP